MIFGVDVQEKIQCFSFFTPILATNCLAFFTTLEKTEYFCHHRQSLLQQSQESDDFQDFVLFISLDSD